jgi:micrococcal nuclease
MHHKNIVAPSRIPADALRLPVVHVGDGDGFRTKIIVGAGVELKASVRFGFIDAPEMSQRGGPEARNYLRGLIGGKTLDVAVTNKTETGDYIDRYGRIVGVPFLTESSNAAPPYGQNPLRKIFGLRQSIVRNVEIEMVLNGWAWVLSRYNPGPDYFFAQDEARRQKRGIWSYDSNLAPWEYKKQVYRGREPDSRFQTKHIAPKIIRANAPCPDACCNGVLKERVGKRGKFFGCSNFPRCKATRNQ